MPTKNKGNKGNKEKSANDSPLYPFVSICTPTFNRRPFVPMMIACFEHQDYPKDRIEWLIIDDGTDKIGDLLTHIPQIKYFQCEEKLTLAKKRNILNDKATGEIILFMDDDDYYPPERISHAVEMLQKNPTALCAGSSAMLIYFKHIHKMYQFGPYGPNHSTAATFAFKRELLKQTRFDENACVAEERHFLKNYTIPFVQLESHKTILVFSHMHNSFDKKQLLNQPPNPTMNLSPILPSDIIKNKAILDFFMKDIDVLLDAYKPGHPSNKPDVTKQLAEIKKTREEAAMQNKPNLMIQNLLNENAQLKKQIEYYERKIKQLIGEKIQEKKEGTQKLT
jgi:glycosyltransferase involved in cell wall biosynthesis